jgi:hypothetical protein
MMNTNKEKISSKFPEARDSLYLITSYNDQASNVAMQPHYEYLRTLREMVNHQQEQRSGKLKTEGFLKPVPPSSSVSTEGSFSHVHPLSSLPTSSSSDIYFGSTSFAICQI